MSDNTFDRAFHDRSGTPSTAAGPGFFSGFAGGLMRDLYQDFRSVPVEAWIILAVATVMSNLFIALA